MNGWFVSLLRRGHGLTARRDDEVRALRSPRSRALRSAADVVVRAASLAPILALALGDDPPDDPDHRATFTKGRALLQAGDRPRALNSPPA